MNKEVSVTGMKLKATAEQGLVISDHTKDDWASSWTISMSSAVLAPTSTPAVAAPTWVRAESAQFDNAEAFNSGSGYPTSGYTELTLTYDNVVYDAAGSSGTTTASTEGIGSASRTVTVGSENSSGTYNTNYVLKRKFFIKGTGDTAWAQNLVIDEVSATTSSTSTLLDNSLRVLVVVGEDAFIYAPIQDGGSGTATTSYKWKGTTDVTAHESTYDGVCASITSIPAGNTDSPIEVDMYMYFEGEDENCKSSNASGITLNDITISANFKTADIS